MGFVQHDPGGLNFNKVTISLWFRVPSESITAAQAKYTGGANNFDYWRGVIPLLTWGAQGSGDQYGFDAVLLGHEEVTGETGPIGSGGSGDIYGTTVTGPDSSPQGPSYIGLRCDPEQESAFLEVLINTNQSASCVGTSWTTSGYDLDTSVSGAWVVLYEYSDASYVDEAYSDYFGRVSTTAVAPDTWHHLLISWDLSGGSACEGSGFENDSIPPEDGITASSEMWMSFDDVNKTENDLPMYWPGGEFDGNRHVSYVTYTYSGRYNSRTGDPVSVTGGVGSIPSDPVNCPAPSSIDINPDTDEPVLRIQVAELQVFTDVTLDTSVEANRRAFVTVSGTPASPSLAATKMGKQPEIRVQTVGDWQSGHNRGTAGELTPTGTISSFAGNVDI